MKIKIRTSVNSLIDRLSKINNGKVYPHVVVSEGIAFVNDPVTEQMAADVLINENGEPDWDNNYRLIEAGYRVFLLDPKVSETLVGGIETEKGIVTYA